MSSIVGETIHRTLWLVEIRNSTEDRWVVRYMARRADKAMKWLNNTRGSLCIGQQIRARRMLAEYSTPCGPAPNGGKPR